MIKIIGLAFAVLICALTLKNQSQIFTLIISISGCLLLFLSVSDQFIELIKNVTDMSSKIPSSTMYIKLMLKALGIVLIAQVVTDICRDCGEGAIANMVEIGAKIIVVSMMIPLFNSVISIVTGLLK